MFGVISKSLLKTRNIRSFSVSRISRDSAQIDKLVTDISLLNLLETAELVKALKVSTFNKALKIFLNLLPSNANDKYDRDATVEYQITDTFSVPGVGTVVNGTVLSGIVHVGDSLLLGPDSQGVFTPTIIKSIQRKRINVPCARAGHTATFALKKTKRSAIRKGMVMLGKSSKPPAATFEFEAEVLVLYHSSTINTKYQTMLHVGAVRQTAQIVGMDRTVLRTGDRAIVRFRFVMHPEFIKLGTRLLFREGRTKGVGKVVRLLSSEEPILLPADITEEERAVLSKAAERNVFSVQDGKMTKKGKSRKAKRPAQV